MNVFRADALTYTYRGAAAPALHGVSFTLAAGRMLAVLGPNGSGKSTLLKLLLDVVRPDTGVIEYGGRAVADHPRIELAREIGVVSQIEEIAFPMTVRELVGMGRYPHLGPWRRETDRDAAAVHRALDRCDLLQLEHRAIDTLSGGERQRARLARALAQEPRTLVLDEPTASLDIAHEMTLFDLLGRLVRDDGVTVLLVTHNINLAARYADELLLLHRGRIAAVGPPADVVTRDNIERVYGWPVFVFPHSAPGPDRGAPQISALGHTSPPDRTR